MTLLNEDAKPTGESAESERQERFTISTHDNSYYCVSIPRYQGGEVVTAQAYDALREAADTARKWFRWYKLNQFGGAPISSAEVLQILEAALVDGPQTTEEE